jgi:phosphatidylserine/phosphatidylglycerophosphate/cardiolipin synthase-like enzyme
MKCEHCQADSGQYPLCLECYKKQQAEQRTKTAGGSATKQVPIPAKVLKYWADKLYAIASSGIDYAETDYDLDRYEEVREISQSLYAAHKKVKGDKGSLSEKQLKYFQWRLDEIGAEGKQYSRNRYDEYRYGEIRLVQNEMVDLTAEPVAPLKPVAKAKEVGEFVSDDAIKPLLISLIDKAKHKLDIASPWITVTDITDRLKKAQERNVQVKVLARQIDENKTDIFYDLIANDIDVTTDNDLHAKMLIVDQQEMFLGSANLSGRSLTTNLEVGIHTTDPPIIAAASAYFKEKFQQAKMQSVTKIPRVKRK